MTLAELIILAVGLSDGIATQLAPVADFFSFLAEVPSRLFVVWQAWTIGKVLGQ